ncbi:hypothetical protein ABB37_09871 [Leptomonas pyrrhocoris]|uniref:Transmembrane protein n=1 Tax=Leptomonas pyrrhocoris TaxID=157538 RepID=A0A0M9FPL7_LEPPY|nr:hypothetical protein ABB37_09871 [Leptomonas pyrrhocoris]KPA73427.1 hypothetical protein ABB37_09871 [Leptomonas pyrrhocoris]|eukprot:XP_015651866.1 hypothetical protein ABB37_09871 [Leptomonas pyrrhocoris]
MESSRAGAAAGYRDPTTLFEDSDAASFASSSSSASAAESDEDYHALQRLFAAVPGLLAAPPVSSSLWNHLHPRKARDGAALTAEQRQARAARRRRQRERQERRFFRDRGALDFQRSAVFEVVAEERPRRDRKGGRGRSLSDGGGVAEAEVWTRASPPSPSFPQNDGYTIFDDEKGEGEGEEDANGDCVPTELQAWYVAGYAAPSTAARSPQPSPQQTRPADEAGAEETSAQSNTNAAAVPCRDGVPVVVEEGTEEASAFAAVAPVVRSSGAGTTSVNLLWSRVVPDAEVRQTLRRPAPPVAEHKRRKVTAGPQKSDDAASSAEAGQPNPLHPPRETAHTAEATSSSTASLGGGSSSSGSSSGSSSSQSELGKPAKHDLSRHGSSTEDALGQRPPVFTADHANGGRPPLHAHRYVEQPNGVFLDHARHADLLAQYALEEQLRYAQEKEDARRVRRWNRLLHGTDTPKRGGAGGGGTQGDGRGSRYNALYDAATYRKKFVSILCCLRRIHIFLVSVAAGVSLITLIAITVPFPQLQAGEAEDGLSSSTAAVLLLAMLNTTNRTSALPAAQVLPVLQQGRPALAVVLALLQPYHASLFVFLCILLVITGFAPVPWGVAERYWTAQRRRWLAYDEAAQQQQQQDGGGAGLGSRPSHHHAYGSNSCEEERNDSSGSAGAYFMPRHQYSPLSRTLAPGLRSPLRAGTTFRGGAGGGISYGYTDFEAAQMRAAAAMPSRSVHGPRLGSPLGGGGGGDYDGLGGARSSGSYVFGNNNNYDALRNSISLAMTRGATGNRDTYSPSGASFSAPSHRAARSMSVADLLTRYHDGGAAYSPDAAAAAASASGFNSSSSAAELPSGSLLSLSRGGGGGGVGGHLSATATLTGSGGWSPPGSVSGRSGRHRGRGLGGGGASSASSPLDGAARSPRGALTLNGRLLTLPTPLLLMPVTALEGRLSADNVFARTFDYIERRTMQWLCNALQHVWSSVGRRGKAGESDEDRGGGCGGRCDAAAGVAGSALPAPPGGHHHHHRHRHGHRHARVAYPAVPVSLYLHVLLEPRLWCVVVALALTLVELAVVDERSVELMWRAQPPSWWSSSAGFITSPQDGALPHTWLTAAFSYPSSGLEGSPLTTTAATTLLHIGSGSTTNYDEGAHVGRVILAVYATRAAVVWVAFLLNLFF